MKKLLELLHYLKSIELLQLFTIYLRYLIGTAFIIAAFVMGKIIPLFDVEQLDKGLPPGLTSYAFASFIHSPLYWSFIGWSQLIAGILLVTQRFARLGVVVYLPIILNIFILTYSYHFSGTDIVSGLMLLAAIYLAIWEGDKLQYLWVEPALENLPQPTQSIEKLPVWGWAGGGMILIIMVFFRKLHPLYLCLLCLLMGIIALLIYLIKYRRR
jgi:hypothetical protein